MLGAWPDGRELHFVPPKIFMVTSQPFTGLRGDHVFGSLVLMVHFRRRRIGMVKSSAFLQIRDQMAPRTFCGAMFVPNSDLVDGPCVA